MTKRYKRGDTIQVHKQLKKGDKAVTMVVVARWARGEGAGYACKLPGQADHECVDVPARRIIE